MSEKKGALTLNFTSGSAMADAVNASGTCQWFWRRSRVSNALHRAAGDARVFVSSDRPSWGPRRYSVRVLCVVTDKDGTQAYRVQRIGGHGAYGSLNGAQAAARRLVKVVTEWPRSVDKQTAERFATRAGIPLGSGWA